MVSPFFAEALGTFLFIGGILLIIYFLVGYSSIVVISALVAVSIFIGLWISQALGGPGYLNPLVALGVGQVTNKSAEFIGGMIAAEVIALAVLMLIYYLAVGSWDTRSSLNASKIE